MYVLANQNQAGSLVFRDLRTDHCSLYRATISSTRPEIPKQNPAVDRLCFGTSAPLKSRNTPQPSNYPGNCLNKA